MCAPTYRQIVFRAQALFTEIRNCPIDVVGIELLQITCQQRELHTSPTDLHNNNTISCILIHPQHDNQLYLWYICRHPID